MDRAQRANIEITCPQCGAKTLRGDLRSGMLSFGNFFIEHDEEKRTLTGAPKPKALIQRDNRVPSFACENCGLVSSYLERALHAKR